MMQMKKLMKTGTSGFATIVLTAFLASVASPMPAGAQSTKPKPAAPAKPAAAPAKPAGNGGAAKPGGAAGGASANHSSGPSANHPTGPTANGTHPTANATHPTANAAGAAHPTANGASGAHPAAAGGGNTAHKSAISSAAPKGSSEHVAKNGAAVRTRADGRVSDIHDSKRGMDIHHGLDGGRRVEVHRADGSRLVAERGRRGFVERPYQFHGHEFARRSYYWHGARYDRYYNHYYYGGVYMNVYAPGYYYRPAFYGWAYNPWAVPVVYGWGWGPSPWYGFYGSYFSPWPAYPMAAFWLTDYMLAASLQAAYAARAAADANAAAVPASYDPGAAQQASGAAPLTPEVKQQIADEVKAQIALENAEAGQTAQNQDVDAGSSSIARLVQDVGQGHPHYFVVGDGLDVTDASTQQECHLSDGDAVQMAVAPAANATAANVVVKGSKGGVECAPGSTVAVNLTDLQEMQNHMREQIDMGMKEMQSKAGTGGLPKPPASAQGDATQPQYAAVAPPPSPQDETDLKAQEQQAGAAETEAQSGGSGTPTASNAAGTAALTAALDFPVLRSSSEKDLHGQPELFQEVAWLDESRKFELRRRRSS